MQLFMKNFIPNSLGLRFGGEALQQLPYLGRKEDDGIRRAGAKPIDRLQGAKL